MKDAVLEQLQVSLVERYTAKRAIGHGAMASVYLAEDLKHGREVAIKVLRQGNEDPEASERFNREIRYIARLQHPHIVPLFDSGDAPGLLYYVTAYVKGESLREYMQNAPGKRIPLGTAVRLTREIANALDYAHAHNVLHRDVKPENILLHDNHALVADFGIARAIQLMGEAYLTATGVAIGTPAYMSPEQLTADRQLDARSDLYALACMFYELIAGVQPFMGARGVVDNGKKFVTPPVSLLEIDPLIPRSLDHVVRKALSLEPGDRFASAGDFARALDGRGWVM